MFLRPFGLYCSAYLVFCLCPSSVHVVATFPGTVLFPLLCSVPQFFAQYIDSFLYLVLLFQVANGKGKRTQLTAISFIYRLRKAYDNVNRDKLREMMDNTIPNYLLNTIKCIYRNTKIRIKFNGGISCIWIKMHEINSFKVFSSPKQFSGDVTSFFFFICFVVCTTRASPVGIPRDIYRICFHINVCMYIYLHNCLFSF